MENAIVVMRCPDCRDGRIEDKICARCRGTGMLPSFEFRRKSGATAEQWKAIQKQAAADEHDNQFPGIGTEKFEYVEGMFTPAPEPETGAKMETTETLARYHSTAQADQPSEGIGELVERLVIANLKLWFVCEKKSDAANHTMEELRKLVADDLALCKSRAAIRAEINKRLGCAVSSESVKRYGGGTDPIGTVAATCRKCCGRGVIDPDSKVRCPECVGHGFTVV